MASSKKEWIIYKNDNGTKCYLEYTSLVGVRVMTFNRDEAQIFDGNRVRSMMWTLNGAMSGDWHYEAKQSKKKKRNDTENKY
jgi:hypothetical protein